METMDSIDQRPISGRGLGTQMMSTRLAPTSDALQQISQTHVPSSQRPASTQSFQPVTGVQIHACRTGTVAQKPKWHYEKDKMRRERPDVAFEVAEDIPGKSGAKRFAFFASANLCLSRKSPPDNPSSSRSSSKSRSASFAVLRYQLLLRLTRDSTALHLMIFEAKLVRSWEACSKWESMVAGAKSFTARAWQI